MNCRRIERNLEAYMEGSLPLKKKANFESHLRICSDCAGVVRERKRWGEMISETMKKTASKQEPSQRVLESIMDRAGKSLRKPAFPVLMKPKWAAPAVLALIALVVLLVFVRHRGPQKSIPAYEKQAKVSYLRLTTVHYDEASPNDWKVKRTHIETSNGEEGFMTLELIKDSE